VFLVSTRPRSIDQNATHEVSADSQEVCAPLPIYTAGADEAYVNLVYQSGGLHSLVPLLSGHVAVSQPVKFLVNEWHEFSQGRLITVPPGLKQS
jgi:hypothetical protein